MSNMLGFAPDHHRFLRMDNVESGEDYVHVDVSTSFHEKMELWLVFFIWLIPTLAARLRWFRKSSSHRAILYVAASLLMLQCRAWFSARQPKDQRYGYSQPSEGGPTFNVTRAVPWEPIMMLWASFILQACLTPTREPRSRYLHILWTTVRSALWITTEPGGTFQEENEDWITLMAQTLGSTLTLTGSIANVLLLVVAYDVITYATMLRDLFVPTSLALGALMLLPAATRHGSGATVTNLTGYSSLDPTTESSLSADEKHYHDLELVVNKSSSPSIMQETEATSPSGCVVSIGVPTNSSGTGEEEIAVDEVSSVQPDFNESQTLATTDGTTCCNLSTTHVNIVLSIGMGVLYVADFNILSIAVGAALIALLYKSGVGDSLGVHVIARVDYPALICFVVEFILVGSLNDTGLPQYAFNRSLGECAENIFGNYNGIGYNTCMFRSASVFGALAAIVSPSSAILMTEATFPYTNPYIWIQIAWAVGIAGNLLSHPMRFRRQWFLAVIPFTTVAFFTGVWLISIFHTSRSCSVRLGECD